MACSCCLCRKKTCKRPRRRKKPVCPKPCCKPRVLAKQAYLCFLHKFKLKHCNWPTVKIEHTGAVYWCNMGRRQKLKFYKQAQKKLGCEGPIKLPKSCLRIPDRRRRKQCTQKRRRTPKKRKPKCETCESKKSPCCRAEPPCPRCHHWVIHVLLQIFVCTVVKTVLSRRHNKRKK